MLHNCNEGGLRKRVRSALAEEHARVDAQFAAFDIQTRKGFGTFLQTHRAAFDALAKSGSSFDGRIKETHLIEIVKAIDSDLKTLHAPILRLPTEKYDYDPLAVDHIVLGSRLGTAVLRAKWVTSQDHLVRQARAYFAQPRFKEDWRAHCLHLSSMGAQHEASQQLIEGTPAFRSV